MIAPGGKQQGELIVFRDVDWESVFQALGGMVAFAGLLAYLGKTAIDAYVSGRVESFKGDLQRVATEHSVRFENLHAERAEVIKEFYAKLAELDDMLRSTLRPFQHVAEQKLQDKVDDLGRQFNELRRYFVPRRIFFEERTCVLIDEILALAKDVFFDITTYPVDPNHDDYKSNREVLLERYGYWEKARKDHAEKFAELKRTLEADFRKMLGM